MGKGAFPFYLAGGSAVLIGRTAKIAYEIKAMRAACCKVAANLVNQSPVGEDELDECARLDEGLSLAHRILKTTVRNVMISRINRRSPAQ